MINQRIGPGRETETTVRDLKSRIYFDQSEELGPVWYERYRALKHAGKIPVLLAESGRFYLASNPADLWGSKTAISVQSLKFLIESLEEKKAVA